VACLGAEDDQFPFLRGVACQLLDDLVDLFPIHQVETFFDGVQHPISSASRVAVQPRLEPIAIVEAAFA
jgi:hypothetical protein